MLATGGGLIEALDDAIGGSRRIVFVGGPKAGKTFAANELGLRFGIPVRSTDDLLVSGLDWSGVSEEVATWIATPCEWVIEGVATARALRKWLLAGAPSAESLTVIWLPGPCSHAATRTKAQVAMARGVRTVLLGILPDMKKKRVAVIYRDKAGGYTQLRGAV